MPQRFTSTGFAFDLGVVPRNVHALLDLVPNSSWASVESLLETSDRNGYGLTPAYASVCLRVMVDAGLITRERRHARMWLYQETDLGDRLRRQRSLRPGLAADLLHFLFFTAYPPPDEPAASSRGWSWIYQETCRLLWDGRPFIPPFAEMAVKLNERLLVERPNHDSGVHRKSPNAVQLWLRELDPPFVQPVGRTLRSSTRAWCSPELLILAIDYLYRREKVSYGAPVLLTSTVWDELERICLVEAAQLETMLDAALSAFPSLGTHTGEWGRSVVLTQPITVVDVA